MTSTNKPLRALRKNQAINKAIRKLLVFNRKVSEFISTKLNPRWRVSGTVPLQVGNVPFKMYANCDDLIVDSIYYGKNDEDAELVLFSEIAKRSKVIFDVGANTGVYSLISALASPDCKIYAFEPYTVNAERLSLNLTINGIGNVNVIRAAVGAENEKIKLTVPADGRICCISSANPAFSRSFYSDEITYTETKVDCLTLDEFVSKEGITELDLVKIDVESFEMEVFRGAHEVLKKFKPVIFCEIFLDQSRMEFFEKFLKDTGYYSYAILRDGLVRIDILENLQSRTFLFSTGKAESRFIPMNEIKRIVEILCKRDTN
jgi:FkbM family methyltransferase